MHRPPISIARAEPRSGRNSPPRNPLQSLSSEHPSRNFNTQAKGGRKLTSATQVGKPFVPTTYRDTLAPSQPKHPSRAFRFDATMFHSAMQLAAPIRAAPGWLARSANFNTYLTVRTQLRSPARCKTPASLALAATPHDARIAATRLLLRINGGCGQPANRSSPLRSQSRQTHRSACKPSTAAAAPRWRPAPPRARPPLAAGLRPPRVL